MKPIFQILVLFCFNQALFSQKGLQYQINIQPNLCSNFYYIASNNPDNLIDYVHKPKLEYKGYSFSIQTKRKLLENLYVLAGFGYQANGYINYNDYQLSPENINYKLILHNKNINLPVHFSYYFANKKNKFYGLLGISPNISFSKNASITYYYENNTNYTKKILHDHSNYRNINYNLTLGIGYEISINKYFNISLQPTFETNLMGTKFKTVDLVINRYLYSLGLTLGIIIK